MYNLTDYLCHYGVNGMKWGIRRYQNKDGTYTHEGKKRLKELSNSLKDKSTKKSATYELKMLDKTQKALQKANKIKNNEKKENKINSIYASSEFAMDTKSWQDSYNAGHKFLKMSTDTAQRKALGLKSDKAGAISSGLLLGAVGASIYGSVSSIEKVNAFKKQYLNTKIPNK